MLPIVVRSSDPNWESCWICDNLQPSVPRRVVPLLMGAGLAGLTRAATLGQDSRMTRAKIRAWDPLIRIIHWLLAAAVLLNWVTDSPLWLHTWGGYLATALVVSRILWGFIGPENARFGRFLRGPYAVFDYLAGLVRFSSRRYVGHSPAGGAMIVALLVLIAATTGTGMASLAAMEGRGPLSAVVERVPLPRTLGQRRPLPLIREVHQVLANVTFALVVLHVAGVVLASCVHRENLVVAMITGRKRSE
jgi:cytochrome b